MLLREHILMRQYPNPADLPTWISFLQAIIVRVKYQWLEEKINVKKMVYETLHPLIVRRQGVDMV